MSFSRYGKNHNWIPSRVTVAVRRGEHWVETMEGELKVTFGAGEIPVGEVSGVAGSMSVSANGRGYSLVVTAV